MKCARFVCHRKATCRHSQNGGFYCLPCARKINNFNPGVVEVPSPTLLLELRDLSRTNVLRTDEEHEHGQKRKAEICRCFDEQFPEDVFDRYGHWLSQDGRRP